MATLRADDNHPNGESGSQALIADMQVNDKHLDCIRLLDEILLKLDLLGYGDPVPNRYGIGNVARDPPFVHVPQQLHTDYIYDIDSTVDAIEEVICEPDEQDKELICEPDGGDDMNF